ncbi:MAG: sulfatase, partial [Acidobacteria bacterium]|nr:sulfatase [Acidobacteriota bacterium]
GTALAWTAGEGVQRMEESGNALQLFPGDGGAELISPSPLAVRAAAYGTLRITFAAHPQTAPVNGTVTWIRSDGAPRSIAFAVEPQQGHIDVPVGEQLTWYGSIDRLSVRFPPTLENAPYALSAIELLPRTGSYLIRERIPFDEYILRDEVSPFEARGGYFLPPDSEVELVTAGGHDELRFALGTARQLDHGLAGDYKDGFTAVLQVTVRDGREIVAQREIPILVQSQRWADFSLSLPASERPLLVTFHFTGRARSMVAIVSHPRTLSAAIAPRVALVTTIDALRKSSLGIYGYRRATPGIDRIGRDGFVFRHAYAQGNNTPTSVLALLNSQYATNAPWSNPHPTRPSLARYLGEHGFHTVMIVSNPALQVPYEAAGFDVVVYINPNSRHLSSEMEERLRWAFRQFRGEDLFVYAHFLDPHAPYAPPQHTAGTYSSPNGTVGRTVEPWLFPERYLQPGLNYPPIIPLDRLTPKDRQATVDLYDEEVLDVSLHLEQLWDALTELGLYDDALIVLSADHGEEFFEHGGVQHGAKQLYDIVTTVPLLVKLPAEKVPGDRSGRTIDTLVEHVDIFPTIVRAFGLPVPAGIAGQNLFENTRGLAISEWVLIRDVPRRAIRDNEWKLILSDYGPSPATAPTTLLFHIADDPDEQHNVAPGHPEVIQHLRDALAAELIPR